MEFVFTPSWEAVVYWTTTVLWLAEFLVVRSGSRGEQRGGAATFWLLVGALLLTLGVTGALYHLRIGNVSPVVQTVWRSAALALYGAGVALRYWSLATLGPWFSRTVRVAADQELVSTGPYRLLRHPLYLGLLLIGAGISAVMGNVPGVVIAAAVLGAVINHRMAEEERLLEETLGARYREWKRTRWRFVPFVF